MPERSSASGSQRPAVGRAGEGRSARARVGGRSAADRAIREVLEEHRPADAILTEEAPPIGRTVRAPVGGRSARRHHELSLGHPVLVREHRALETQGGRSLGVVYDPASRRAVRRGACGPTLARRGAAAVREASLRDAVICFHVSPAGLGEPALRDGDAGQPRLSHERGDGARSGVGRGWQGGRLRLSAVAARCGTGRRGWCWSSRPAEWSSRSRMCSPASASPAQGRSPRVSATRRCSSPAIVSNRCSEPVVTYRDISPSLHPLDDLDVLAHGGVKLRVEVTGVGARLDEDVHQEPRLGDRPRHHGERR